MLTLSVRRRTLLAWLMVLVVWLDGVDAGKYARQLMSNVVTAVQKQQPPLNRIVDLRQAL